jgi:hypothetical protein
MSALRTATQQGIDGVEFLVRLARAPDEAPSASLPEFRPVITVHSPLNALSRPGIQVSCNLPMKAIGSFWQRRVRCP